VIFFSALELCELLSHILDLLIKETGVSKIKYRAGINTIFEGFANLHDRFSPGWSINGRCQLILIERRQNLKFQIKIPKIAYYAGVPNLAHFFPT
jgi:hypothetical protein